SAHATGEGSPPADHGHHADVDPKINDDSNAEHPAGNSVHADAQHDDNDSPAVTDGAHPTHGQAGRSEPASPKSADDGDTHPGKASHAPPGLRALSNELTGDDSGHGTHTAHGQADRTEPAGPKSADDGGTNAGKVPHDPPGLTALSSDASGDDSAHPFNTNLHQHASADPDITRAAERRAAKDPTAESLHTAAQDDDTGSPAAEGAHAGHGQVDGTESASPKSADDGSANSGKVPHDPAALTALPSNGSGDDSAQPFQTNLDRHASADPDIT